MLFQSPPRSDVTLPANLHHLTLPKQCQPLEAKIQIAEPMEDISQLNDDIKELLMGRQTVTSPDCSFQFIGQNPKGAIQVTLLPSYKSVRMIRQESGKYIKGLSWSNGCSCLCCPLKVLSDVLMRIHYICLELQFFPVSHCPHPFY